jgi:hypothetical protein
VSAVSWSGSTTNGVATYGSSSTVVAETNLTFDGTKLTVSGDIVFNGGTSRSITGDTGVPLTIESGSTGSTGENLILKSGGGPSGGGNIIITSGSSATGDVLIGGDNSSDYSDNVYIYAGSATLERVSISNTQIVINENSQDYDFRIEGSGTGKEYMLYLDAGSDQIHMGDIGDSATIANRLIGAEVTVGSERAWSTSPSSTVDNMFFYNYSRTAGDGVIGGSISFSGPDHGGGGGGSTTANRRHAVIGGIQGGTEADYVGLTFWTHNSISSTGAMQESMRLLYNGNLHVDQDVVAYSTVSSDVRLKKDYILLWVQNVNPT